VSLLTGTHSTSDPEWGLIAQPIVIDDYAWVGQGATILPGVIVGAGAVVGAGSVVTQSVDPYSVVSGNPARATEGRRPAGLQYEPVRRIACVAAWLGPSRPRTASGERD
jgi:acetyltransferase-like isoleucine patch superfamily enzyme